jgi:hypothetical protein
MCTPVHAERALLAQGASRGAGLISSFAVNWPLRPVWLRMYPPPWISNPQASARGFTLRSRSGSATAVQIGLSDRSPRSYEVGAVRDNSDAAGLTSAKPSSSLRRAFEPPVREADDPLPRRRLERGQRNGGTTGGEPLSSQAYDRNGADADERKLATGAQRPKIVSRFTPRSAAASRGETSFRGKSCSTHAANFP